MPGVNLLGLCGAKLESPREYSEAIITFGINGSFTSTVQLPGGGESEAVTPLSFSRTFNYSRIPYSTTGAAPSGSEMQVTQFGCCCDCRYDLNLGGQGNSFDFVTGVVTTRTVTDTAPGNPTTTQHFPVSGNVFAHVDFKDGVEETGGPFGFIPCKNTDEGNRNLAFVSVDYTNNFFTPIFIQEDDYTYALEVDGASVFHDSAIPGVLEATLANDLCEGTDFTASASWSASKTVGNQSEALNVTCFVSATLI